MGASLTYDHVNYLIWRYLQERGYGKTAIQLQREWSNPEPHALPFTSAVQPYFLIQMLQDGLAYDKFVVEARRAQHEISHDSENVANEEENTEAIREMKYGSLKPRYSFVNITKPRATRPEDAHGALEDLDRRVKRPRVDTARRKPLRPASDAQLNGDTMDLDEDDRHGDAADESVDEALVKEEPPPIEYTLDKGQSVGFQTDDIKDTEQEASLLASHSVPGADIFGLKWNDLDEDKIIVSGGCAWHSLAVKAEEQLNGHAHDDDEPMNDEPPAAKRMSITAEANYRPDESLNIQKYAVAHAEIGLQSNGTQLIAQAIEELDHEGAVYGHVDLRIGDSKESIILDSSEMTVVALRFNPAADHLLAVFQCIVAGDDDEDTRQGVIRVWQISDNDIKGDIVCERVIHDVAWISDLSFVACGSRLLSVFTRDGDDSDFEPSNTIDTVSEWDHLRYDSDSNQMACLTGSDGVIGILDLANTGILTIHPGHEDAITALRWQPGRLRSSPAESNGDETMAEPVISTARRLATSSTDGTVKLWETKPSWTCLYTFLSKVPDPVWSIEFSRDGSQLAAACERQLTIWKAEPEGQVIAKYRAKDVQDQDQKPNPALEKPQSPIVNGGSNGIGNDIGNNDENVTQNGNGLNETVQDTTHNEKPQPEEPVDVRGENLPTGEVEMAQPPSSEDGIAPGYCLAWDHEGKRIAQALGDTVSIIALPAS